MKDCPNCRNKAAKVIFAGFPMYLCEPCENNIFGFWSFIVEDVIPFNGVFVSYEGSYLKALWHWLTYDVEE